MIIHLEILALNSLLLLFVSFTVHEHHNKIFAFSFRALQNTTFKPTFAPGSFVIIGQCLVKATCKKKHLHVHTTEKKLTTGCNCVSLYLNDKEKTSVKIREMERMLVYTLK